MLVPRRVYHNLPFSYPWFSFPWASWCCCFCCSQGHKHDGRHVCRLAARLPHWLRSLDQCWSLGNFQKKRYPIFIGKMLVVPWDWGPPIINPISTLYFVGIYWVYTLLKGSNRRVKQVGYHPKGTSIFPMIYIYIYWVSVIVSAMGSFPGFQNTSLTTNLEKQKHDHQCPSKQEKGHVVFLGTLQMHTQYLWNLPYVNLILLDTIIGTQ